MEVRFTRNVITVGFAMIALAALPWTKSMDAVRAELKTQQSASSNYQMQSPATAGTLDPTFNGNGEVVVSISPHLGTQTPHDIANAIALQSDGKIVLAGYARDGASTGSATPEQFALARLNTNGSLDTSFDSDGVVTTQVSSSALTPNSRVLAVAVQSDGKIVAAGFAAVDNQFGFAFDHFALVRYNANGSLDTSFGTGGKVSTSFGNLDDVASALVLQTDGKILVAGTAQPNLGDKDFAVVRYNPDGTLDTTFGTGGKVTIGFGFLNDQCNAVALQTDGRIIAAGEVEVQPGLAVFDYALARYNTNGTLDANFGTGGKVTTNVDTVGDEAQTVVVQPDAKILVVGAFRTLLPRATTRTGPLTQDLGMAEGS